MAHPTLYLTLLGDFRLTYEGQPVSGVNRDRLQSLLAYLVLHCQSLQPRQRTVSLQHRSQQIFVLLWQAILTAPARLKPNKLRDAAHSY